MATPTWKGPTDQLVEANNSPTYNNSKNGTIKTRIYHGLFSFCETEQWDFAAGTVGTGSESGFISAGVTLNKLRGNIGQLAVSWEANGSGSGAILPADEFSVVPNNLNPRLETHPRFVTLTAADLANVETALRGQNSTVRDAAYALLGSLGQELVTRIRRGNESYYLASLRYSWVTYSWTLPTISRGGFVDTPGGPLASYFVSDISWLREADDLQQQNGIHRWTRNWLGGPDGNFDSDLDT